jgi:S1-C subfamily serine protease
MARTLARGRATGALALPLLLLLLGAPARADGPVQTRPPAGPAVERAKQLEKDLVALVERVSKCYVIIGGGSGVVVSPEGDILTNHHVAGGRKVGELWTVMRPGTVIEQAKVIGHDPRGDISLLKLEGKGPYPYLELTDSDQVRVGDAVVALGNPFGFSKDATPHVTLGVVSALHRFQDGYSDAIQTDVAINPGNSGGPLLDIQGRVIGINGRIAVRYGTRANTGVGYAIPTNQIRSFIPQFREKGLVLHGHIQGIGFADAPHPKGGALVERVASGSAPAEVGLKPGDVIVEADGRPVSSPARFSGIVGTLPAGSSLPVVVRRGEETVKLELALEARRGDVPDQNGFLGVKVSAKEGGGIEVEEVVAASPAARAGVQPGDVILSITIGGRANPMNDLMSFTRLMGRLDPGQKVGLSLKRGDATLEVEATLARRPAAPQ